MIKTVKNTPNTRSKHLWIRKCSKSVFFPFFQWCHSGHSGQPGLNLVTIRSELSKPWKSCFFMKSSGFDSSNGDSIRRWHLWLASVPFRKCFVSFDSFDKKCSSVESDLIVTWLKHGNQCLLIIRVYRFLPNGSFLLVIRATFLMKITVLTNKHQFWRIITVLTN